MKNIPQLSNLTSKVVDSALLSAKETVTTPIVSPTNVANTGSRPSFFQRHHYVKQNSNVKPTVEMMNIAIVPASVLPEHLKQCEEMMVKPILMPLPLSNTLLSELLGQKNGCYII